MSRKWTARGVGAILVLIGAAAARGQEKDPIKEAGLVKSGEVLVLPDETAVLDQMKDLRTTKVAADKETRARTVIERQIVAKKKIIKDDDKEWHDLDNRLSVITDVGIHNRVVIRMNRLVVESKTAMSDEKDLEEQSAKLSVEAKTKFVDQTAALSEKAAAVMEKYKAVAADPTVTAELTRLHISDANLALGPSAAFAAANADLTKWQSEVESEAIPLREGNGVHEVDALINGEHFMMGVDTGATDVSITGDVAEKLNIMPGPQAPTIQVQMADGHLTEGHQVTLKSVRVGRFTVEDVPCVVLDKGLSDAPLLLGGSFLNHFIVKVDPAASELHLTEVKGEGGAKVAPTSGPSGAEK